MFRYLLFPLLLLLSMWLSHLEMVALNAEQREPEGCQGLHLCSVKAWYGAAPLWINVLSEIVLGLVSAKSQRKRQDVKGIISHCCLIFVIFSLLVLSLQIMNASVENYKIAWTPF